MKKIVILALLSLFLVGCNPTQNMTMTGSGNSDQTQTQEAEAEPSH